MKFKDTVNFISKISLKKSANFLKIFTSYQISHILNRPVQWGLPVSISIEPTTSCNLRCPECPSGKREFTRPTGMLDPEFFKKVIDQVSSRLFSLTFYFQGEPFLNPKFLDMVTYASGKKIYTTTSTNGHYLNDTNAKKTIESGLDRLIISIDGTTQETYEKYRIGGDLKKVIEGTENVVKWKRKLNSTTPHIIFQFLVVKPNEHQIKEVKKLGFEIGVDEIKFKTAQVYNFENGNELIPNNEKYSRYRKGKNGKFQINNKLENRCWKLWHSCVITWDGSVVPCCFDKDANYKMGELNTSDLKDIWYSDQYQNFRTQLTRSRKEIDICKNCTEGTKVWN